MPYKFMEDVAIADVCIEATGKTKEEMFENAGLATTSVMVELKTLGKKVKDNFTIEAESLNKLLYEFLEEIVYIKDTDGILFSKYKIKLSKDKLYKIKVKCEGEKINSKKQTLLADVKAVTLHMFEVKKVNCKWYCRFVLDI